jgi:PqqD family protein of HPr-rel-A system
MRWRAAPDHLIAVPLDTFTAVFHRPSGQTHLLVEPAPQILMMLSEPLDEAELLERLLAEFDVADDRSALSERVRELAEAGLIAPA